MLFGVVARVKEVRLRESNEYTVATFLSVLLTLMGFG